MGGIKLWGSFSVVDHRRERPFIADALLYDRLVIPVPDDDAEVVRWRDRKRDPDGQRHLLEILGDLVVTVPWSQEQHARWRQHYVELGLDQPGGTEEVEPGVRVRLARDVEFDANNIAQARRRAAAASPDVERPDDPAQWVTRLVLARERNQRQADLDYLSGIPAGKEDDEVQTVVAYGSQADFVRDCGTLAIPGSSTERPPKAAGASQVVFAFESRFLVPDDDRRTDDYLLGQAVELAHTDEIQEWRAALNRWRRRIVLAGIPEADAERQLTDVIADYDGRSSGTAGSTAR
jgi:hypothetical protein